MKKALISSIVGIALLRTGSAFGYLEDKMYCKFEGEQLTLYVKKEAGVNKCEIYIKSIEQLARNKYDEVMLVMNYINQWEDVAYRREIFELKKQEFLKLIRYRTTIVDMVQSFEQKFLIKYQDLLVQSLAPYLENLQKSQSTLSQIAQENPTDEKLQITLKQTQQQILAIDTILNASSLDEIMQRIPNYLYLKQALEWK